MSRGLVFWGDGQAKHGPIMHGLPCTAAAAPLLLLPYTETLFVGPGVAVPWHLVEAGFRFLGRWEAAAPLGERLAAELGSAAERELTEQVVGDLRMPVFACKLLFVRNCDGGQQLVEAWVKERSRQGDGETSRQGDKEIGTEELAFLRALHQVKPIFLALPRSWQQDAPAVAQTAMRTPARVPGATMVQVEIAPGRYVCCRPDEVEKYRQRFQRMRTRGRAR